MARPLKGSSVGWDNGSIGEDDYVTIATESERLILEVKRPLQVFEFGPGNSTKAFLEAGCQVISAEHDKKWFEYWKDNLPNQILFYRNIRELERLGTFDLIFVDAPHGNRMKQCHWAARHTRRWCLHDARINQHVPPYFKGRGWQVRMIETKHGIYEFTR